MTVGGVVANNRCIMHVNCKTDSAGVIVSFHISASRSDPGEEEILARIILNEVTI